MSKMALSSFKPGAKPGARASAGGGAATRALLAVAGALALAVLIALPFVASGYVLYIANLLAVYVILALGLNLLVGETGQFGLAHVAFYGIGIYTTAILGNSTSLPFPVSILCGALLATAIGFVLGAVSLRMRDIYLALSTFAFGQAMQWVFLNWVAVTNGPNGMRISPAHAFGWRIGNDAEAYPVVIGFALLFLIATVLLSSSRLGRAFRAVRESEPAAQAVGIDLRRTKIAAFSLSAFYAGAAGGVFATFSSFIHPESLGFQTTIMILTMIVVGGLGTIPGAVIGAVFLGTTSELLRQALSWQEVIYGAILIGFMMFLPRGLWGAALAAFGGRR